MKRMQRGLIDGFFIIVIFLSLLGILLRMQMRWGEDAEIAEEHCAVVLLARTCPSQVAGCINAGETLYGPDGRVFGKILDVRSAPGSVVLYEDGREYLGAWDASRYCDLSLVVDVSGRYDGSVFLQAGRYAIPLEGEILLSGERTYLAWRIKAIQGEKNDSEK